MQVTLSLKSVTHRYFFRFFSGLSWKGFHYRKSIYPDSCLRHLGVGFFQFITITAKRSSFLDHCIDILASNDHKDSVLENWYPSDGIWIRFVQVRTKKSIKYYQDGILYKEIKL